MTQEGGRWAPLPPMAPPGTACTAHKHHQPVATYCELHHVIPQAWQGFWGPGRRLPEDEAEARIWASQREAATGMLWDPRTVALCPTGHRNVHFWLVRLMRGLAPNALTDDALTDEVLRASMVKVRADARARHTGVNLNEFAISALAIERVVDANNGGLDVLAKLVAGGMWGEA